MVRSMSKKLGEPGDIGWPTMHPFHRLPDGEESDEWTERQSSVMSTETKTAAKLPDNFKSHLRQEERRFFSGVAFDTDECAHIVRHAVEEPGPDNPAGDFWESRKAFEALFINAGIVHELFTMHIDVRLHHQWDHFHLFAIVPSESYTDVLLDFLKKDLKMRSKAWELTGEKTKRTPPHRRPIDHDPLLSAHPLEGKRLVPKHSSLALRELDGDVGQYVMGKDGLLREQTTLGIGKAYDGFKHDASHSKRREIERVNPWLLSLNASNKFRTAERHAAPNKLKLHPNYLRLISKINEVADLVFKEPEGPVTPKVKQAPYAGPEDPTPKQESKRGPGRREGGGDGGAMGQLGLGMSGVSLSGGGGGAARDVDDSGCGELEVSDAYKPAFLDPTVPFNIRRDLFFRLAFSPRLD